MKMALALGARGLGHAAPNPSVGCVIVKDGRVVGRGVTAPGGRPHAETQALAQAGSAARGADVYVTLEPCSHHGKTPPCAQALVTAGVGRVVVAVGDPNPSVAGQGIAMLHAAGITTRVGVQSAAARRAHAGFFNVLSANRPFLTLKSAASLDGRIATATGQSKWITGAGARRHVHANRARHDAVMVGGGTARSDDPMLNVRDMGVAHQPARVVVTRKLDIPLDSALARSANDIPLWLIHGADADPNLVSAWRGIGANLAGVDAMRGGHLDPGAVMGCLAQAGMTRVYCEGGASLAASLLAADLVDEMHLYSAGKIIGAEGLPMLGAMGLDRLEEARRLCLNSYTQIGDDALTIWSRAV